MQNRFKEYLRKWVEKYREEIEKLSQPARATLMVFLSNSEETSNVSKKENNDILRIMPEKHSIPLCKFVHQCIGTDECDSYYHKAAQKILNGETDAIHEPCLYGLYGVTNVLNVCNIHGAVMSSFGLKDRDTDRQFEEIKYKLEEHQATFSEEELKNVIEKTPKVNPEELRSTEELILMNIRMIVENAYKSFELENAHKDIERRKLELEIIDSIEKSQISDMYSLLNICTKKSSAYFSGVSCSIFLLNKKEDRLILVASSNLPKEEIGELYYKKGEGLTGWVWKKTSSLLVNNINDNDELREIDFTLRSSKKCDKYIKEIKNKDNIESTGFLGIPIFVKNKLTGVFRFIMSENRGEFSEYDKKVFETFITHIFFALYKKRKYGTLNHIIKGFLSKGNDLCNILNNKVARLISRELFSSTCSIFLLSHDKEKLILTAHCGIEKKNHYDLKEDDGFLIVQIFKTRKSVRLASLKDSGNELNGNLLKNNTKKEEWSFLGVPIKLENKVVGVIKVMNENTMLPDLYFSKDDQSWVEILAVELAVVIENINSSKEIDGLKEDALITESLSSIGLMASGISHRFGNYLGAMRGSLANIKKNINNESIVRKKIKAIEGKFQDMSEIIDGLNDSSRKMMEKDSLVNINEVICKITKRFEYDFNENNINFKMNLDENIPLLNINIGRIQNMFDNLINNAIDAMQNGGRLSINTYVLGYDVKIEVCDTGEGIPAEIRSKIFTPFFTTKEEQYGTGKKGTGLGLFLSQKIIKDYGGNIELESEKGEGSKFLITIPLSLEKEEIVYKGSDAELFTNFYERMYKEEDQNSSLLSNRDKKSITVYLKKYLDQAEMMVKDFYEESSKTLLVPLKIAKDILEAKNVLINGKFDTKKVQYLYHNNELINEIVNEIFVKTKKRIYFTLFQVKSLDKSAIRIATNVPNAKGELAFGTKISEPVYKKIVINGNDNFFGRAWVVVDYYLSVYEKVVDKDNSNNIPVIIYVGFKEDQKLLDDLEKKLKTIEIFKEQGYVDIVTSQGKVVIHPYLHRGFDLSKYDFFKKIKNEELLQYYWKSPEDANYKEKINLSIYSSDWKWTISAIAPLDKLKEQCLE